MYMISIWFGGKLEAATCPANYDIRSFKDHSITSLRILEKISEVSSSPRLMPGYMSLARVSRSSPRWWGCYIQLHYCKRPITRVWLLSTQGHAEWDTSVSTTWRTPPSSDAASQ